VESTKFGDVAPKDQVRAPCNAKLLRFLLGLLLCRDLVVSVSRNDTAGR